MKGIGISIHYIGVFIAGAWIVSITINTIWPENKFNPKNENQSKVINTIKKYSDT